MNRQNIFQNENGISWTIRKYILNIPSAHSS